MGIHISQIRNKYSFLKLSPIPVTYHHADFSAVFRYGYSNPKFLFFLAGADNILVFDLSLN